MINPHLSTFREYLADRRSLIETALDRFLPQPPQCPAIVAESMRYSLGAGGKRLRPILTLTAAEVVGGPEAASLALPAACAIELIHTYSLIHDDLPAMDNDTLRRGRPTNHVVFGEGQAILAGDGLLTEAFSLLAREPTDEALALRKLRVIATVSSAAGALGMVGGQAIDLQSSAATLPADALREMHARKTGALIRAAATAGAIMAGGDHMLVVMIETYATELGLAFQIVDDVLDVEGQAAALGKTLGKDAALRKPTYVALFGPEGARREARECANRARQTLNAAGLSSSRLEDVIDWVIERNS